MKKILIFLLVIFNLACAGALDEKEMIAQAELSGKIMFIFKDAETNLPLGGVEVMIIRKDDSKNISKIKMSTDERGIIEFGTRAIEDIMDGKLYIGAQKKGYIEFMDSLKIETGTVFRNTFAMTKTIPLEKIRFVLTWAEKPMDLDLHLRGKNLNREDFHISYRDKKSIPNLAKLDRDDTNGYGPETITLDRIEDQGEYSLFVHNYSNDENIKSSATVHVYANGKLDKVIHLKDTDKRYVEVLKITDKEIDYTNVPFGN